MGKILLDRRRSETRIQEWQHGNRCKPNYGCKHIQIETNKYEHNEQDLEDDCKVIKRPHGNIGIHVSHIGTKKYIT